MAKENLNQEFAHVSNWDFNAVACRISEAVAGINGQLANVGINRKFYIQELKQDKYDLDFGRSDDEYCLYLLKEHEKRSKPDIFQSIKSIFPLIVYQENKYARYLRLGDELKNSCLLIAINESKPEILIGNPSLIHGERNGYRFECIAAENESVSIDIEAEMLQAIDVKMSRLVMTPISRRPTPNAYPA